jgi:ferredoxin
MAKLKVSVDRGKCQAHGACMKYAPATFALDDERKVRLVQSGADADDALLKAARVCPYRVIALMDEETGGQVFPPVRK